MFLSLPQTCLNCVLVLYKITQRQTSVDLSFLATSPPARDPSTAEAAPTSGRPRSPSSASPSFSCSWSDSWRSATCLSSTTWTGASVAGSEECEKMNFRGRTGENLENQCLTSDDWSYSTYIVILTFYITSKTNNLKIL